MGYFGIRFRKLWILIVVLALSTEPLLGRRGGGGFGGGGRGASGARASSARGTSGARSGIGTSGGGGGGGYRNTGGHSGGGIFGSGAGYGGISSNNRKDNKYNKNYKSGYHGPSTYTKGSGIGSKLRSNTFKNMIVGAAAGYLTYQAGKAIIRHTMGPMMWNNRPYYWGQNYYQQRPNERMCRMPMDGSDPQLSNVYFADNTRPREIVWGCGYNEYCCGYECCRQSTGYGGYGYGSGSYSRGIGLGSILALILFCGCGAFIIHQVCKNNSGRFFRTNNNNKYTPGQVNEPPPEYNANYSSQQPPPQKTNFVYG